MNGRNIMIVGDSLQEEMYFSLLSALRATFLAKNLSNNASEIDGLRKFTRDRCDNYCVAKEKEHETCKSPERIDCGPSLPSFTINFARTDSLSLFANGYHFHK